MLKFWLARETGPKDIELEEVKLNHENTLRAIHESHRAEFAKLAAHNVGTSEVQRKVEELEEHVRELTKQLDQSQTWQTSQRNFLKRQLADALEDREAGVGLASPEPLEKIKGVRNHHARLEALYQDLRRQLSQVPGPVPASVCKTTDLLHTALEAAFHEVEEEASSLTQQLEVADKQVKSLRQFLADQAEDREAEREEHQLKIARLEAQFVEKDKEKTESMKLVQEGYSFTGKGKAEWHLCRIMRKRIEALERQLEQRNEMCRGATDSTLRMERALKAANEKITDLNGVISAAEQRLALKQRAEHELREEVEVLKNTLVEQGRLQQELNEQIEFLRLSNGDRPRPDGAASNFGSDRSDSPQVRAYVSEPPHLFQELKDLIQVLMERVDRKTRELEALQISATDSDTSRAVSPLTEDISVKDRVDKRFTSSLEDLRSPTPLDFLQLKPLEDLNRLNVKLEQLSKIEEVALKRIRDMEIQLKTAREAEKMLSEECQGLRNEVKSKDAELKELVEKYDMMNCYNLELKSETDELQTEFSAKEKLVASLEMRIASMEPAVSSLGSFEELKMKLQDAHQRQEELEYSLEKKESQVRDLTRQLEEFRQSLVTTEAELIKLRKEKSAQEADGPFASTPISAISRPSPEHSRLDLKLAQRDAEIEVLRHEVSELREELEAQKKAEKSVSVEELRDAPQRESLIEFSKRENLEHTTVNEKSHLEMSLNLEAPRSKSLELESVPKLHEDLRETMKELQWKYERKLEQCEYSEKECDLLRETVHDLQAEVRELLKKIGDQDRLTSALQASKKTLLEDLAKLKSTLGSQAGLEEETEKKIKNLQADCDNLVLARDSLMSEVDDLRSLLSRYQEQAVDFKSERDTAFKKVDELSLVIDELQKELKEQTDANDELHRQLCEAQDMAAELQCSLQEANRKIETELERVTNELSSVKNENEKLERAPGNMKEASCKLQTDKNELMIECSKLKAEIADLKSEISKLKSDYSNRITDLSELNLKYKNLCDLYDSIVAQLRQKQDELLKAQDEKTFLGLKVDDLTDDLKVFREKNAFLTEDITNLKVTVGELSDENAELKAHLRTLRNQLENDVMKVSVDDLFDKVEDELNQTARYDKSVLAYVDTLNSPNMLPTPEWSCDEGIPGHSTLVPGNGKQSPSVSSIDGSLEERDLAKKVHKEGMKVLALSEDLFARHHVRDATCPSCGREEAETPVVLVDKTVVRPDSPTRWRAKAISLEREVERLKTELNIEKMISDNQRKSNESTQHHLLSIVSTMNKERSNAASSQEEIVTLKDQIKSLRLQLISSNEEVKSMRCLLSDENETSKSHVSSSSSVKSESDSARKLNRKLSSQVAKLKEDKEKLISAVRSLNAKIVEMQRVKDMRPEEQTDGETDRIIAAVAAQPGEIKQLVHHYLTRALKAESSRKALVYQKRYLEKVVEAQRAEVTIRNLSEYSETKKRSFRVVSLMVISCIRMKLILRMRATRLKKLKNSVTLPASK